MLKSQLYRAVEGDAHILDTMLEKGVNGVWFISVSDMSKAWVSTAFYKSLGYVEADSTDEAVQWHSFLTPSEAQRLQQCMQSCINIHTQTEAEHFTFRGQSGEAISMCALCTPVAPDKGSVTHLLISLTKSTVSDRQHIVLGTGGDKIISREDNLLEMLKHFPGGSISLIDKEGIIRETGGKSYEEFGILPESMRGKHMSQALSPEVAAKTLEALPKVLKGEAVTHETIFNDRYFINYYEPVVQPDGSIVDFILVVRDIHKERTAQIRLKKLAEERKNVLESINDGFFTLDNNMCVTYFNKAAEELLGFKREDIIGEKLFDFFSAAKGTVFEEEYTTALRRQVFRSFEAYFPTLKDWYRVKVYPYQGNISVYFQVVTQEKLAAANLKRTTDLLTQTNEVARVGGWEYNFETQELYWSPLVHQIFGVAQDYTPTLEEGLSFYKAGESRQKIENAIEEISNAPGEYDLELLIESRIDGEKWVRVMGKSEFKDGKCQRMFGAIYDIDERKRAKLSLLAEEKKYESLVQNIEGIVWEYCLENNSFTFISERVEEILGRSPLAWYAEGSLWKKITYAGDLDKLRTALQEVIQKNTTVTVEHRSISANNKILWFRNTVKIIYKNDREFLQGIMVDISREKEIQEHLLTYKKVFDSLVDGVCMLNLQSKEVYTNKAFNAFWVLPPAFSNNVRAFSAVTDPAMATEIWETAIKGETWRDHIQLTNHHKGQEVDILLRVGSIKDEEQNILALYSIHTDVSNEKSSEKALKNTVRELEKPIRRWIPLSTGFRTIFAHLLPLPLGL